MNPFIKKILIGGLGLLSPITCVCTINFADTAGSIAIDTTNSSMYLTNPAKIIGWGQNSVVKAYGDNTSDTWPEVYTSNAIIGQTGQSGITIPTRTNLVDANSNAIACLGTQIRATSNLLLYVARTYSSSIVVLNSNIDSTNASIGGTSNAINYLYSNMAVPSANSIDGSLLVKYCPNHYVFHNGSYNVRGWVRFNNGFTVMPQSTVLMDTLTTVSGGMDLRDSGILVLNNDLYLSGAVTLTNGGNIKGRASCTGQANTIFLGGDLTLASDTYARTLHITGDWSNSGTSGDLIIDGCGHTLNIGDRAQIFVDQNVTLTLRNMTIKTGAKSLNNPAIQLASFGSKLALDNVMFDLGADFHFPQGQIFIHDEVAVTGTSAFVYQSPKPSYITSGATWSFEQGTTFSVAPSTFTDCPFTVNNTYTNNAFIVLADASSALSLNGCSLQTTFTGLRLRSGMVLFDNKVAVDTTAGVDLNSTTPLTQIGSGVTTGNITESVAWSPDSKFLAVVNFNSSTMQVYQFDGINAPTAVGSVVNTNTNPRSVAWSPDGKFLAVAIYGSPYGVQVYRFNGSNTPTPVGNLVTTGTLAKAVAWSPDGKFLALTYMGSPYGVQIYRFNGVSSPVPLGNKGTTGGDPYSVAWSPDGRFLAIPNQNASTFQVYRFNGSSTPTIVGNVVNSGVGNPYDARWSSDGRFLLVAGSSPGLMMYRFNGMGTPIPVGNSFGPTSQITSVAWSPDGRFFVAVNSTFIRVYRFDGTIPSTVGSALAAGSQTYLTSWSPDGNFVAVVNSSSPGGLHVFRCNYVSNPTPQSFSNGLLFGDKAQGSSLYDANVQVLAGAMVKVKGKIKDDSV